MYKLIFCDKNKSLVKKVDLLFKKFKNNKWDLELEAIHSNIFEIHKKYGWKIVTASNPQFTYWWWLDAQIKKNFPNEVISNKEFERTDNLFKTITVDSNYKCNKKILERALIWIFGYRKEWMILSWLWTTIWWLSKDDFIEVLRKVLSANLSYANLSYANLRSADISYADLSYADLSSANLHSANLRSADLRSADLRYADLGFTDLNFADLNSADLRSVNLRYADLHYANLNYAKNTETSILNENTSFFALQCPEEGEFTAWKKCINNTIVKLLITKDAKRSSATTRKCRASKAKVIAIYTQGKELKETVSTYSTYDKDFIYTIGEIVEPKNWYEDDRWTECGGWIHFFITRKEAEQYN